MNDTPTLSNTPRTYMAAAQSFDRLMQESEQLERELAAVTAERDALREDKQALRNRLISAMCELEPGEYEVRRAHAEAKVNEFEEAFDAARKEKP